MSAETEVAPVRPELDDGEELVHIGCLPCGPTSILCGHECEGDPVPTLEPGMLVCALCQLEYQVDPTCRICGGRV